MLLLGGCKKADDPPPVEETPPPVETPAPTPTPTPEPYTGPAEGDVLEVEGGVRVEVLAPGRGTAPLAEGDPVRLRYEVRLEDGTIVDAFDDSEPLLIEELGSGRIVPGLEDALLQLYPGLRARITIPPERAYGAHRVGEIPPDSTLVIEIQVLDPGADDSAPDETP